MLILGQKVYDYMTVYDFSGTGSGRNIIIFFFSSETHETACFNIYVQPSNHLSKRHNYHLMYH